MKASLLTLFAILAAFAGSSTHQVRPRNEWHKLLPDCPCRNPDWEGVKTGDGWAQDQGDIQTYHKGASACFRSYPYTETSAGKSGQQCCYDSKGDLIQAGPGAGTPDKVSTCAGEDDKGVMRVRLAGLVGHYFNDVKPWHKAGSADEAWRIYNQQWVPNKGKNCSTSR